jgi:hypothetical protein
VSYFLQIGLLTRRALTAVRLVRSAVCRADRGAGAAPHSPPRMRRPELGLWVLLILLQSAGSSGHTRRHKCESVRLDHGVGVRVGGRVVFSCSPGYTLQGPSIGTGESSYTANNLEFMYPDK